MGRHFSQKVFISSSLAAWYSSQSYGFYFRWLFSYLLDMNRFVKNLMLAVFYRLDHTLNFRPKWTQNRHSAEITSAEFFLLLWLTLTEYCWSWKRCKSEIRFFWGMMTKNAENLRHEKRESTLFTAWTKILKLICTYFAPGFRMYRDLPIINTFPRLIYGLFVQKLFDQDLNSFPDSTTQKLQ